MAKTEDLVMKKLEDMDDKLERMDNKLERIKSHTNNLSRVASISSSTQIKGELMKAVGKSEIRAAILHLTKGEISGKELVRILAIKSQNLSTYLDPFMGNRSFIAEIRKGGLKYYQRDALVDLVGFDTYPEFAALVQSWESKRMAAKKSEPIADSTLPKEENNVS